MVKFKSLIVTVLLIVMISGLCMPVFAASFNIDVKFDGKNISMESENPDTSWTLDNFLPGNSDTSSVTINNNGQKTVTVETSISIEEDTGLLEKIDLEVKNKAGEVVYTGAYTELKTITKQLAVGENETYTVKTSLNKSAGNEYQNKQYKLKFNFNSIGNIPNGKLTIRYVDKEIYEAMQDKNDVTKDLEPPTIDTQKINSENYNLPSIGKEIEGYYFDHVEGNLNDSYKEEGSEVIYFYNKIKQGRVIAKYIVDNEFEEQVGATQQNKVLRRIDEIKEIRNEQIPYSFEELQFEGYEFTGVIDGNKKITIRDKDKDSNNDYKNKGK